MLQVKYIAIFPFVFLFQILYAQTDSVGPGGAIRFDGVDDYIDFGDIYSDLELPFTISGWVYLDPSNNGSAPIFSNRNCDPIYTGFRLIVNNDVISMDYGDGRGGNNPAFRRGKNANVSLLTGNWNQVTAVVKGESDIDLYLNGINVGGSYMGGSNLPMDSSKPGFASSAYFISNGVIYRLNGIIDDIRLWNRALSESEIRNTMCINLIGNEAGLIGYWNFNETSGNTVFDLSSNHFNGTFIGSPSRVRSGAPIGDHSTHLYSSSWTGKTISLSNNGQTITVKNISSSSGGVQVYSVNNTPSEITGLGAIQDNGSYFGVFMTQQNSSSTFGVDLNQQNGIVCDFFARNDNSSSSWLPVTLPLANRQQRIELIQTGSDVNSSLELGNDVALCNEDHHEISTKLSDSQYSFRWSNDQTTSSILVTESGKYSVTVTGPCSVMTDSVTIQLLSVPEHFSLGNDTETCDFAVTTLRAPDCSQCTIQWQDGSTDPEYLVTTFGTYWVVMKNSCGQVSDSIVFARTSLEAFIPNVITPNDDEENDFFIVPDHLVGSVSLDVYNRWGRLVHHSGSYTNQWNGGDLSSGVYFTVLNSPCIRLRKNILHIIR